MTVVPKCCGEYAKPLYGYMFKCLKCSKKLPAEAVFNMGSFKDDIKAYNEWKWKLDD